MTADLEIICSLFSRWATVEDQKAALAEDSKILFQEAKRLGLNPKTLRAAFQRVRAPAERRVAIEEFDAEVNLYGLLPVSWTLG
jgi:uncharacterized protein (UPF0335 family)